MIKKVIKNISKNYKIYLEQQKIEDQIGILIIHIMKKKKFIKNQLIMKLKTLKNFFMKIFIK